MNKFIFLIVSVFFSFNVYASSTVPTFPFQSVRLSYSSTNVPTSSWVQLVSSLAQSSSKIEIFDSSGQTIKLGIGSSGNETQYLIITPGGNGMIDTVINAGTRISLQAISATATSGEIDINFYQQ